VYNGSAGRGAHAGISQMDQKHAIQDMLGAALPLTTLGATLFMEEFWKRYTRPGILRGTFSFAVPPKVPLQMVSVKDMGRVAALVLADRESHVGKALKLAGDELTPLQMAAAFGEVQGRPVSYRKLPTWPFWLMNKDLYRIIKYYSEEVGASVGMYLCVGWKGPSAGK
jgi:uncharacterized protein YbjT (DUF2867 family)